MKNKNIFILSLFLFFSFQGNSNFFPKPDTISHWTIQLNNELFAVGNLFTIQTVILRKGKIKSNQLLKINYYECARCTDCKHSVFIKNTKGKIIKTIKSNSLYSFVGKTTELLLLAAKEKNSNLCFYFQKNKNPETALFDLVIR